MDIFVGKLTVKKSKTGEDYFIGDFGKIPVKGFYDKKNKSVINLSLDASKIAWIDKQSPKEKREQQEKNTQ